MPLVEQEFAALPRDPRLADKLADYLISPTPAWLWSADGSRILWANAVGAAIFGSADAREAAARRFDAKSAAASEVVRLVSTLPASGQARLERLRGFGASFGLALTCVCSREIAGDAAALLIVATEPAGPSLSLRERIGRLVGDKDRTLAAFTPDGALVYANDAARERFGGASSLAALGIADLATKALAAGHAEGPTKRGPVALDRLGRGAAAVLVAEFGAEKNETQDREVVAVAARPAASRSGTAAVAGPSEPPTAFPREPAAERLKPLRFVWQMDADGHFVIGSDEFIELMGPRTTAAFGRLWSDIAADLKLDPDNEIGRAVATHETWSGVTVSWPVDDGGERLPIELSGLPVFDREREFRGYRGFGVCRDLARINELLRARRERPVGAVAKPEAPLGPGALHEAEAPSVPVTTEPVPLQPIVPEQAAPEPPMPEQLVDAAPEAPGSVAEAASTVSETASTVSEAASTPAPAETASVESAVPVEGAVPAERPVLNVVPAAANVVPFRGAPSPEPKAPALSPVERKAFRELAQELTARLRGVRDELGNEGIDTAAAGPDAVTAAPAAAGASNATGPAADAQPDLPNEQLDDMPQTAPAFEPALLDRLPIGVLVYRHEGPNDTLLYANRHFLEMGGHDNLGSLAAAGLDTLFADHGALSREGGTHALSVLSRGGTRRPVEGRLFTVPWGGAPALALILTNGEAAESRHANALSLTAAQNELRELRTHVESYKKTEAEMRAATRETQKAAAARAEFVNKVSHELRTPLNAITGFAEVMMAERFGPIGNERYREYLKDIHGAGMHLVSLLNDLLDLSKVETGQLDLSFANVSLNDLTQQCVGLMQPQASRARIIIRTSLTPGLPQVVADERSLRQIVLNLLSNSIRFTGPGGQVIVSTAFADTGEAVLRVRDTGAGMSEKDVEAALEPFRQTVTSGSWGSAGTGLGLPLTKALAEANRAHFSIKSAPNAGTLVEVAFPLTRVVAG
jgi:signal transduction histidine kinase